MIDKKPRIGEGSLIEKLEAYANKHRYMPEQWYRGFDAAAEIVRKHEAQSKVIAQRGDDSEAAHADMLAEALRFYADEKHWFTRNAASSGYHNTDMSGSMERYGARLGNPDAKGFVPDVGVRARKALAAHDKRRNP